jgi:cell division protein FtsI (penicillin-binding protein 3)
MIGRRTQPDTSVRIVLAGHDAIARPHLKKIFNAARSPSSRRIYFSLVIFAGFFALIAARLVELAIVGSDNAPRVVASAETQIHRPDITDRNGEVMATDIGTASLYADARYIVDARDTAQQISTVLTDLDAGALGAKLETGKAFNWVRRDLTPRQQQAIHYLGLPGLKFRDEEKRVYPNGRTAAHVLGSVDLDNRGTAGIERYLDHQFAGASETNLPDFGRTGPVALSLDLRVQYALRDELATGMAEFGAKAAVGIIMDVHTGEIIALNSLPDFDPNEPVNISDDARFNRATLGVYELGSVFKAVTLAAALDSGKVRIDEKFDASKPMQVGRFKIHDFHAENRWLTTPEVFIHSSNIGTAKIALTLGREEHRDYLRRFGLLSQLDIEVPEKGTPLVPARWTDLATITASYGHGIAVTPVQVVAALAAIVNGGMKVTPTLIHREQHQTGVRLVSENVSREMVALLRSVVVQGTGKKADVAAYPVIGKTGTAEKAINGGYADNKLITSFISAFPANDPRYAMIVMFDEPQGSKATYGFATAGWNAAPVTARVVARVAPLLGLRPAQTPNEELGIQEAKLVAFSDETGQ